MDLSVENPELSEQMHAVNHRLRRGWSTQLAPFGLSPHQYRALAALVRAAEHGDAGGQEHPRGMRLAEIAQRLRIAPRSTTEVIDVLEEKSLVRRGPDPTDRRATLVSVTEGGRRLHAELRSERLIHAEEFFAVLSTEDREELSHILSRLLEAHPPPVRNETSRGHHLHGRHA